jgi:CUG-BP- and ETR3-like factor
VFFARVLRSATEDAVRALFARYGKVADINLFRAFQGAPTTKGCGLVTMSAAEEATAAIAGLHEQHVWPGMTQPMVRRLAGREGLV